MLLWLLVAILGLWILKYRQNRRKMYKLVSLIPKSKEDLPIIGLTHKFIGNMEKSMETLKDLSYESMQQSGIIRCRLGLDLYCILTNPADLKFVLKTCLEKADLHRFMKTALGNGIIFAPVNIWKIRRKCMAPAFSPRNLDRVVDILSNQSKTLASVLEPEAKTKKFSIWNHLISYAFVSVTEVSSGSKPSIFNNENLEVLESLNRLVELVSERILHFWLQPNWLYRFFPQYKEHKKYLAIMRNFAKKIIKKLRGDMARSTHKQQTNTSEEKYLDSLHNNFRPFLSVMIMASGGAKGFSDEELTEDFLSILAAATDTTSITIGNILKILALYPRVQQKLYEELYEVFGHSDRSLVSEDLTKLHYMTRVVKETLRLFPPVPLLARKNEEDVTLPSGRVLPTGSSIICSIFGAHRDPRYWGPNVEHFDPDRFLPERFNSTNACFIPFSYGPRNCVGRQYGMMSVKTALAAILRRFRVLEDNSTGSVPLFKVKFDVTMKAADGYQIALEERIVPTTISKSNVC